MAERSDQEWIRLLKQDDPQTVQDLWVLVFTVASREARYRHHGIDTEDLAHQAAIAAYQKLRRSGIHSFRFDCSFRWFCTVVVVRELYRAMRKKPIDTDILDEGLVGANDVPRVPAGEDLVQNRLQLCIGELPERKQRVIRMLYYEELSPQAVADRLTIERNNVNKLAHDARLKLRECLKRHGFGSSEDVLEM
ncbi:MAG: sigma-70 family RNA polymerase sigma factor [Anaerolineae bacterium]